MDLETRRRLFAACDPDEPLEAGDDRYVDADHAGARGAGVVERIARPVELSDRPQRFFVTAVSGAGMTTELKRLAARLGKADGANLLPVWIDAPDVVDIRAPIALAELLVGIVYRAEQTVQETEKKRGGKARGFSRRYWSFLTEPETDLEPGELVGRLATNPAARARVRLNVDARRSWFLEETRRELILLNERARQTGSAGLLVLFDSLHRLAGLTSTMAEVLDSAERVFASDARDLQLPVPAVYTLPLALVARPLRVDVLILPMFQVRDRQGAAFPQGVQAARELIRRRLGDDVVQELLGPRAEERIAALINGTAGSPKDLVRLLQILVTRAKGTPFSDEDLDGRLQQVTEMPRRLLMTNQAPWLARVARDHRLGVGAGEWELADRALANHAVFPYADEMEWFDIHPTLRAVPDVAEAYRRATAT